VAANFSAPDSTFDFLAQGETLTVTYKVTVTDSHGLASTQPVTIVVTGSNDAPVIVSGSGVSGSIAELPNGAGLAAIDQTSGVVKFHDPDLNDRPTASLTAQSVTGHLGSGAAFTLTAAQVSALDAAFQFAPAAGNTDDGSLNWTYRAQDASLDFLGAGESVTVVSTLKVDDHHGGVVSQDITVTVTGANDAPTLLPDQNGVRQHSTLVVDKAHGVLSNDTDPDTHDLLQVVAVNGSAAGVGHAINGQYGALTLNADGSYTYVAKSGDGQFAEDVFTYTAADGHGGTTTETLNLSVFNSGSYIQGSAANPIITAGNGPTVLAAGVGNETLTAGNGPDVFLAGWGKDVMNAGHGPDTFEFDHNGFGSVTINNFEPGHDTLAFRASAFSNLTALPQMVQVGQDVVITVDAHDTIILHGVAMNSLRASDFSFI
ncbi:MAG: hypothetical protein JWP50_2111, partial [Phenylobacterium sp.]|nr:hypothetical protein [Phenylobacterium sp.]